MQPALLTKPAPTARPKRRKLVDDDTYVRATQHAAQDRQLAALVKRMCTWLGEPDGRALG